MIPPVVDVVWLREHLDRLVPADVRWYLDGRSGRAAYMAGHLPGAIFVDLDTRLAGPRRPDSGRHPLPAPEAFAEALGELGIGQDDVVIGYDDAGGVMAARLVWMLRAIGVDAALLDGGLQVWPGPLESGWSEREPSTFTPKPWPSHLLASIEEVSDRANLVIDARPTERYSGEDTTLDPRAGHIPGSVSVPCREHLTPAMTLLPGEELRSRFAAVGVRDATQVISSCGSGITACHNLLVMEHVGLGRGRLYPGSWSQYADTDRPVATGDDPG